MRLRVLLTALVVAIACLGPSMTPAAAALAPAGWATGGNTSTPYQQQVKADAQYAASECAENSALLFRVRGSGASYGDGKRSGQDKLGQWSAALGDALVKKGWSVRDMQAIYDAPPVPLDKIAVNFAKAGEAPLPFRPVALEDAAARSAAELKQYRDVATDQWPQVRQQLERAAARCPAAKIVIAGYSQGGIVLRYLIRNLSSGLRRQIAHVDLVADPTADDRADGKLTHTGVSSARATQSGIDTFLARVAHVNRFQQAGYPSDVVRRVTQHCLPYDFVCDANLVNFEPTHAKGEGARHASYPWAKIGAAAARSLQTWSPRRPAATPTTPSTPVVPTPLPSTSGRITAGSRHTCALRSDGTAACWGADEYGQSSPPSGAFTQLSAGGFHTCGLRPDGTVACWGWSLYGQSTPPSGTFTQLSSGFFHTCGLRPDGAAACWGWNNVGESTPPGGTFTQLSAGSYFTCGLRGDGTAVCWGSDDRGRATPPAGAFAQLGVGGAHGCGLRPDGTVACWGWNDNGQTNAPGGTFTQLDGGEEHTCGLRSDGTVACWGAEDYRQSSPPSGTFTQLSAGYKHNCGLRSDGTLACWGDNEFDQATPPDGTFN